MEREIVVDEQVVDHPLLAVARRGRERRGVDESRRVRRRLLLEEALAAPPVGVALHGERALAEVWDEHVGDVAVVREQLALRDPLLGPERLVEVRELERATSAPDLRLHGRSFHRHIVADPEVHGRP
jgi:hypothetical protein